MAKHRHLGVKVLCAVLLSGVICGVMMWRSWEPGLAVMKFDDRTPARLIWGDRIYDCSGFADGDHSVAVQIGTVKGMGNSRVFRVKGKPEEDSLIVSCSDEMTTYELYRREMASSRKD